MGFFDDNRVTKRLQRIEASKILSKSGGKARAKALSPEERSQIAKKAADMRWQALRTN